MCRTFYIQANLLRDTSRIFENVSAAMKVQYNLWYLSPPHPPPPPHGFTMNEMLFLWFHNYTLLAPPRSDLA